MKSFDLRNIRKPP